MGHAGYEVVLLRHGQTVGYDDDRGLTDLGERQASERGQALADELEPGTTVVLPHARSARATATAVVLRRELVAALGGLARGDGLWAGITGLAPRTRPHSWSFRFVPRDESSMSGPTAGCAPGRAQEIRTPARGSRARTRTAPGSAAH